MRFPWLFPIAKPAAPASAQERSAERQRRIVLNTMTNFLARGFSLAMNLLVIRLVLGQLGKEEYGLWVVLTTLVMWTTLLDFGMLNSLVNAVAEAYGKDDWETLSRHISTAFYFLVMVALALAAGTAFLVRWVHWRTLLAIPGAIPETQLRWCLVAVMAPFIVAVPLAVLRQVYTGLQKTYIYNIFNILSSLLSVAAVLAAIASGAGLPWLVLASGVGMPIAALCNLAYLAKRESPRLRPKLDRFSAASLRRLLRSSIPLFLFQLGALMVNYAQPFLLARVAGYRVVADYSLLLRLYSLAGAVIVLSTSSFFPAFREAFEKGDRGWVRKNFARMLGLRMGLALAAGSVLAVAGNPVLRLWLGKDAVDFTVMVWLLLAAVLVVSSWGTAFSDLLTVMDDLWIQVAVVLLNGAATVGLTLWLAPRWGIPGALAAAICVPLLVWSWAGPALSRSLLSGPGGLPGSAGKPRNSAG